MSQLMSFLFSARWSVIINIVLAAMLGYSTVQLFLLSAPTQTSLNNPYSRPHQATEPAQVSRPTLNISPLLEARLFGKNHLTTQTAIQIAKTLPETKLNLKLHGIYYSSVPHNSFAIVSATDGKSDTYRVGESLPGGTVVHQISAKQVILLRNGRHETLHMVGEKDATANKLLSDAKNVQTIPDANDTPGKLLGQYQRQLRTNPNQLTKLVRISPVKQDGRLIGYRLRPRKDATLLSQLDLQSGDILTSINGVKLDSPLKGLGVVPQLATANRVDLQVLRNGQLVSLSFAVEK